MIFLWRFKVNNLQLELILSRMRAFSMKLYVLDTVSLIRLTCITTSIIWEKLSKSCFQSTIWREMTFSSQQSSVCKSCPLLNASRSNFRCLQCHQQTLKMRMIMKSWSEIRWRTYERITSTFFCFIGLVGAISSTVSRLFCWHFFQESTVYITVQTKCRSIVEQLGML